MNGRYCWFISLYLPQFNSCKHFFFFNENSVLVSCYSKKKIENIPLYSNNLLVNLALLPPHNWIYFLHWTFKQLNFKINMGIKYYFTKCKEKHLCIPALLFLSSVPCRVNHVGNN